MRRKALKTRIEAVRKDVIDCGVMGNMIFDRCSGNIGCIFKFSLLHMIELKIGYLRLSCGRILHFGLGRY